MKFKFLLPVLAMIFAIGISFAEGERTSDPNTDYIIVDGNFQPIGMELDCGDGDAPCRAQSADGNIYEIYDAPDPNTQKMGGAMIYLGK